MGSDPITRLREALRKLRRDVGSPTLKELEAVANRTGHPLLITTASGVVTGIPVSDELPPGTKGHDRQLASSW